MKVAEDRQVKLTQDQLQAHKGLATAILAAIAHAYAIGKSYKDLSKALDAVYADIDLLQKQDKINKEASARYS
jgi:hypothetical protein